ncbi:hypothetical protein Tsubulata_020006 [Turnera subulata]|uniref:peptidyl-tRNA hydrolase n=1 Tax=Turnera subulata TaxID=218843 RepID=A0A9Q0J9V1_9ROSI|nr:hypothetical protein Tsubulata_020006 [Turnera subulata]
MAALLSPLRFTLSLPHSTPLTIKAGLPHLLPLPCRVTSTGPPTRRCSSKSMSQPTSESGPAGEPDPQTAAEEVLVQYVVLRRDLIDTWPMGSVVTQGCHASVAAIWSHKDDPHTLQYCSPENIDSMHKVTLEVKGEPQILNLSEKLKAGGIAHKLWIEQPENFPTCLATKPYPKSAVSAFFKKLKLCK